ncbi:MFS transporter [Clostridium sp. SYSU_GA19001]|uniref:MFS transporter n=1 Tax=Clostridium caldaquaticum TaxID=2940653 RepID=UPI0020774E62|nr:MFS transporter [Clostridium caldaquaticum]MCM8711259.1 MFS transporter [Clostridium caldaquaticum]
MFENKKFAKYSIIFMILGVVYMFFYSGLMNDHINILTPYMKATYGWDDLKVTNPVTYGSTFTIIFYLICGTALVKFGVKKFMIPCTVVLGLACMGLAVAGDNYALYTVSLFLVRVLVVPLQMGGFMLCSNWFIKYRGRVMGVITAGSPLFSVVGVSVLTKLANSIGIKASYTTMGIIIIITALLTAVFMKDTPEEAGLFPDGADKAPVSEVDDSETVTFKEIITDKRAWQLIISYGILQFVITAMMAYMAVRYISLSGPNDVPNLFVSKGLLYLSIGAIAGIPMSYVLGVFDDKWGSIKASLLLTVLYLFAVIPLAIMPVGGNSVLMLTWAFGVACMTGGVPTMHPCVTSYVYGRKKYQAANRWIMTLQAIPLAFAVSYMAAMNQAGKLTQAYYGLLIMLAVAFITLLTMLNVPDANAADREYGSNKKVSYNTDSKQV